MLRPVTGRPSPCVWDPLLQSTFLRSGKDRRLVREKVKRRRPTLLLLPGPPSPSKRLSHLIDTRREFKNVRQAHWNPSSALWIAVVVIRQEDKTEWVILQVHDLRLGGDAHRVYCPLLVWMCNDIQSWSAQLYVDINYCYESIYQLADHQKINRRCCF